MSTGDERPPSSSCDLRNGKVAEIKSIGGGCRVKPALGRQDKSKSRLCSIKVIRFPRVISRATLNRLNFHPILFQLNDPETNAQHLPSFRRHTTSKTAQLVDVSRRFTSRTTFRANYFRSLGSFRNAACFRRFTIYFYGFSLSYRRVPTPPPVCVTPATTPAIQLRKPDFTHSASLRSIQIGFMMLEAQQSLSIAWQ